MKIKELAALIATVDQNAEAILFSHAEGYGERHYVNLTSVEPVTVFEKKYSGFDGRYVSDEKVRELKDPELDYKSRAIPAVLIF